MVVVPNRPGRLIRVDGRSGRPRDEFDDVIDELLPDTDEGPGWFDTALVAVGAALIAWSVIGTGPTLVLVLGVIAALLGCILPARSLLRRLSRRRRSAVLAQGHPMQVSDPVMDRLTRAYNDLCTVLPTVSDAASPLAAAHSAVVEVATLLNGRSPESAAERDYAAQRATAIEALTEALRHPDHPSAEAMLRAREELDPIGGYNSLTRLGELTAELRTRHAPE